MLDRPETGQSSFPVIGPRGKEGWQDLTASTLSYGWKHEGVYREAWTEWLTKVFSGQPTSLVTLTFAPRSWERDAIGPTGPTRSRVGRAGDRFVKRLTLALARPSFFVVREVGGWNGRAHLHCLLSSTDETVIRAAMAGHQHEGFTDVKHCVMSPTEYVTKYVSKSDSDWWRAGGPLFDVDRVLERRDLNAGGGDEFSRSSHGLAAPAASGAG